MFRENESTQEQLFEGNPEVAAKKLHELVSREASTRGFTVNVTEESSGPRMTLLRDGQDVGVFRFDENLSAEVGGKKKLAIVLDVFGKNGELQPIAKEFSLQNIESFVTNCFVAIEGIEKDSKEKALGKAA